MTRHFRTIYSAGIGAGHPMSISVRGPPSRRPSPLAGETSSARTRASGLASLVSVPPAQVPSAPFQRPPADRATSGEPAHTESPPHCSDRRAAGAAAIGAWVSRSPPVMEQSEIGHLRDVWQLVEPDKVNHGVEILIRLFDRFPETKAKFKRLNTSSAEAMRQSARVRAHAGRVLVSLGSVIASLEDAEMVDETIFLLGDSHNRRGVTPDDFQKFTLVMLDYLSETLGDAYPEEAAAAYKKLMDIFNTKMGQHLNKLSDADLQAIRSVWTLVEPDKVQHGVEVLIRLFDRFPETKAKFKRLNTSSAEAMRQSARVRAHAGRVLVSLGSVIASLEDAEMVDETIFLLGDSHNRRGVTPDDFQKFTVVFLDYLTETLGDSLTPNAAAAYRKLMDSFNSKIGEHLDS
ncbi:uncharacterized protein LOC122385517 isoform X2 [Amphibalanus amphitrite]|uniref:uncharacterized protein LOC122385517 isoform X2 n=1 Tax=Amphibalanus amphitrite TaxID=1232801 RepID=UPI001C9231E6|nr:uncharacterized protein LOC122385517 isoform X2 [Amphibalanus amphitrite]